MNPLARVMLAVILLAPGAGALADGTLAEEVRATEVAFAATMAARDLAAFESFLDPETIFFSGAQADRGKAAVSARWAPYFEGPDAPFSWAPETVEVLDSGELALSSGPVYNQAGERVATFSSIWRRNADGDWLIIFDKGAPECPPPPESDS